MRDAAVAALRGLATAIRSRFAPLKPSDIARAEAAGAEDVAADIERGAAVDVDELERRAAGWIRWVEETRAEAPRPVIRWQRAETYRARDDKGTTVSGLTYQQAVDWLAERGFHWDGREARPIVTEVRNVMPPREARLYDFVVSDYHHREAGGFRVSARGPHGAHVVTTVFGNVTELTVVGAHFWRS
jgi:hypothetical protein